MKEARAWPAEHRDEVRPEELGYLRASEETAAAVRPARRLWLYPLAMTVISLIAIAVAVWVLTTR